MPHRTPPAGLVPVCRWSIRFLALGLALVLIGPKLLRADKFPIDPVEQFRQALMSENAKRYNYKKGLEGKALEYALKYRETILDSTARKLRSLSELSRALLLIEWPRNAGPGRPPRSARARFPEETPYDVGSRDIERDIRARLVKRFVDQVKLTLNGPPVPYRQVAVCMLVGETALSAEELDDVSLSLYDRLAPLAKDLSRLLRTSTSARVKAAACRALGRLPRQPDIAAVALRWVLARGSSEAESVRLAAAEALVNLVQAVSGSEPIRGSEPGVMIRETRRTRLRRYQEGSRPLEEVTAAAVAVTPAAGIGLSDSSAEVRFRCMSAVEQAASALAVEINVLVLFFNELDFPPSDPRRKWSKREEDAVEEGRKELRQSEKVYQPAIRAFYKQTSTIGRAAVDSTVKVRLEARRALDAMGRLRSFLRKLEATIPEPRKKGIKDVRGPSRKGDIILVADKEKHLPPPVPRLPAPPGGAPPEKLALPRGKAPGENLLGEMLRRVADEIVEKGFNDPNPIARRAALEVIESMEKSAGKYIDAIIAKLKDRDLFVRWIAARILGKLAPLEADRVVPALVCMLDDEDLDAGLTAAKAIAAFGPAAKSAVKALAERVNKSDSEYRIAIMKALESIGTDAVDALPAVAKELRVQDPRVRAEAARVLGLFGTSPKTREAAAKFLPQLQRLTRDPDSDVRKAASAAIIDLTRRSR